jgi:hypothetical protein
VTGADRSTFTESFAVLEYTKTTDSPISIGNDTDYSTEEKIVGTWIDGKPIYQKTVIIDFTKSSTTREYVNILDMSSYNVDTFVNGFGSFINDVSSDVKTKIFTLADQNARATIVYDRSTKYLQLLCYELNGWKIKGCVTIQYTKTTD